MLNIRKFLTAIKLIPQNTSAPDTKGEIRYNSTTDKLEVFDGVLDPIATETSTATFTNKNLDDSTTAITDTSDPTKRILFDAAGTTGTSTTLLSSQTTNKVLTLPNATDTLVGKATTDVLTNKTLSGNTATNLINGAGTFNFNSTGTITTPNATDTLVGKATTDTLTNKTFGDAATFTQISTPSNPSAGFDKLYVKSDDKFYSLNSAGVETQIGSGTGSGGTNYIANPNAEANTAGWVTYADAAANTPVNGIGGSPSSTWTRSTSTPLRGTASFLWTKAGSANRQGEGVAYDFTIDKADLAKPLAITCDYTISSGTFTASNGTTAPLNDGTTSTNAGNSDLEFFIYDVTNAILIPVSPQVLTGNQSDSYTFKCTFQTASNSLLYRLIIHTATTTTNNFTVEFDTFFVGPQSVSYGPPVSDWTPFTPTGSFTSNVTYTGFQRRVGDTLHVKARVFFSGTTNTATFTLNLPAGLTIDTNKITAITSVTDDYVFGEAQALRFGVADYNNCTIVYNTATSISIRTGGVSGGDITTGGQITNSSPFTWNNNDVINLDFIVPVVGWSSTVLMSNDTDTRVVAARYTNSSGISPTSGVETIVTNWTQDYDTHAAFNATSGLFTVPVSGKYKINTSILWDSASWQANKHAEIRLQKNGVATSYIPSTWYSTNNAISGTYYQFQTGDDVLSLVAGDTISVAIFENDGNGHNLFADGLYNWVTFERLSGPSAIAATEIVSVVADTPTNSIPTPSTFFVSTGWTKRDDSHNAFDPSTGIFTVPSSGRYGMSLVFYLTFSAATLNNSLFASIFRNGVQIRQGNTRLASNLNAGQVIIVATYAFVAGDLITFQVGSDASSTVYVAGSEPNSLSIWSIN